jgi:hypothetical protein
VPRAVVVRDSLEDLSGIEVMAVSMSIKENMN